jgi:hypothetical protein
VTISENFKRGIYLCALARDIRGWEVGLDFLEEAGDEEGSGLLLPTVALAPERSICLLLLNHYFFTPSFPTPPILLIHTVFPFIFGT